MSTSRKRSLRRAASLRKPKPTLPASTTGWPPESGPRCVGPLSISPVPFRRCVPVTITAKVLADSVSPWSPRVTTLELRYPRFIHSEFMTHRVFSRNASSSRAIPVERLIQDVLEDTAMPIHWGKNQKGMQARQEHDALVSFRNDDVPPEIAWGRARDLAVEMARKFSAAGYHKQIVNRLLEPFVHINVVVTATEWDNFFNLRLHEDAQPEIYELARAMKEAMDGSTPKELSRGQWHLPYIEDCEDPRISAARCARVSYKTHDGRTPSVTEDLNLFEQLVTRGHLSPLEHVCRPSVDNYANLVGWRQLRKVYE